MTANFLSSLICRFAPKTYASILNQGKAIGRKNKEDEVAKLKESDHELRMVSFGEKYPIGSFVVSMPNESVNPIIGRVLKYNFPKNNYSSPMLTVYDYVSKEELVLPCVTFPYNKIILSAIMAQNAQERHASYYGGSGKIFAQKEELIPDLISMKERLDENGFYRDLKEWQSKRT